MKSKDVVLGTVARDIITGFEGVIVGKTTWLNGCDRIGLQPRKLKDGKLIGVEWFDVEQVKFISKGPVLTEPIPTGGPKPDPVR